MSLFSMTEFEAQLAFEAIAIKRLRAKCECDHDVGFECRRCKRESERVRRIPSVDPWIREQETAYRWARIVVERRRVRSPVAVTCETSPYRPALRSDEERYAYLEQLPSDAPPVLLRWCYGDDVMKFWTQGGWAAVTGGVKICER